VYLTAVKQNGMKLKFDGVAQSSTRVSSFMRNIDGSQWLRNPELEVVQTIKGSGVGSNFTLTADQVTTAGPDDAGARATKGKIRKASLGGTEARQ
jgi:type IV pilus assembly protein PilN